MAIKKFQFIIILIFFIIALDQLIKFYVKTSFILGDGFKIFDLPWAQIKFVENYGAAFGMELGGKAGKIALSFFRLFAGVSLFYFTHKQFVLGRHKIVIYSLALITAGAFGNIIDGVFYGVVFSDSTNTVAEFLPANGGYSTFFDGHVVDMFYFPIIDTYWPNWLPGIGGKRLVFNNYVFNLADAAITIGVVVIIFFYSSFEKKKAKKQKRKQISKKTEWSNEAL